MIGPVSAVLLNWKRWYHLEEIVTHLRTFGQIRDIHIVCNGPIPLAETDRLTHWFDDVHLHHPGENLCTLGRFVVAARAKHDAVFTADDDLLTMNIPQLLAEYDGTRTVANLAEDGSSRHWTFWQLQPQPYVELGFGSIFPKQFAIDYLAMMWTDDEKLRQRKSDKAMTILFPWTAMRAGPEGITRLHYQGHESGRDDNALYKRPDHAEWTRLAVEAAMRYKASLAVHAE